MKKQEVEKEYLRRFNSNDPEDRVMINDNGKLIDVFKIIKDCIKIEDYKNVSILKDIIIQTLEYQYDNGGFREGVTNYDPDLEREI